jgi:hypothetical protein
MQVRKALVCAAVAASVSAGMPAADAHTSLGLVAGGSYTGVILNGLTVAFDCTAAGAGDSVSVAITKCQLTTSSVNKTIALPGPTASIGGTAVVPFQEFRLCYSAVFTFSDSHTVPLSGCNELLPTTTTAGGVQLAGVGYTTA